MAAAKVHVTKLAAAERQLKAAIHLYLAEEDELAVHTIAAAAYRLLADLKHERGMNEVADSYLTSVFYVVRDYRRGTLPKRLTENAEFMEWVAKMADELPIQADTDPKSVHVGVSPKAATIYWNRRNKVANFLKHADRDARATLALDELDNLTLLLQGLSAYLDLTAAMPENEGFALQMYLDACDGRSSVADPQREELVRLMSTLDDSARRRACLELLHSLNKPTCGG